jgi:hypothetical protein
VEAASNLLDQGVASQAVRVTCGVEDPEHAQLPNVPVEQPLLRSVGKR